MSGDGETLAQLAMPEGADSPVQAFYLEWRDFLRQCRTGARSEIDAETVEATTAVIEQGRASVREVSLVERAS